MTPWPLTENSNAKKRTYASNALLYALFVIGAVVVVNLLSTRVFGRIDLTEHKVYTLSQPSKDLVKKLPDYMTVKAFMSKDLPPELKTVSRYVRDLIDEYKTSSNGKFRWEAIDPGTDKKLEEEANRCKVQKLQIQVLRNQKFELGQYYLGLCLEYGSQVESIPQVARAEGLEYQISSLIKKMTTKKKKVAFTNGHGEADTNQGFQALKGDLEQEFEITTVNPSQAEIAKRRRRPGGGRPQAGLRREGAAGDRQVPDERQGRGVPGRRHGHAGARAAWAADAADEAEDGPGQRAPGWASCWRPTASRSARTSCSIRSNAPGPLDLGSGRPMLANVPFFVAAEVPEGTRTSP